MLRILLPALAIAARLGAQDVTVSPSISVYADDQPDQLPVSKRALHPEYPDELRKSQDLGYATEQIFVDDRGRVLSVSHHSTIASYLHDLSRMEANGDEKGNWDFTPARRAGKPVNSLIHFCIIFNPHSAGSSGPDATPRLLDAKTVVDPERATKDDGQSNPEDLVVWATVSIGENGQPKGVRGVPDATARLLEGSVKDWRFAPARHAGQPVEQDVRVPFIVVAPGNSIKKDQTFPHVIKQYRPVYPVSMRRSGMRGEVLVDFIVNIEGRVIRPHVIRSLNPAFDEPAIDSVSRWVFEPGTVNGIPVYTHMKVPIIFTLYDTPGGGGDGLEVRKKGAQSKMPEAVRVDVAPKMIGIVYPVYPYELLRDYVDGLAQVSYVVDQQGRVTLSHVRKADKPEFGLALQAAVDRFEYEPGLKGGRPNDAIMGFEQEFDTSNTDLVTIADERLLRLERKHPEKIGNAGALDTPLKAEITRSPIFPRSLPAQVTRGDTVVEFLVDEDGRPRLPRIVSASDPAFGYSAVQAIALWRFPPPRIKGDPVVVRVREPFTFDRASPAPSGGTAP